MANVLITGASKGFGKLTVERLLKDGHTVVAAMRGLAGKNKAVAQELRAAGAKAVELDVADEGSVERGVRDALAAVGSLDVVVNNAGVGVLGHMEAFTAEDWKRVFEVNVFGVQRVNRAVVPHMRQRRSGLLVHVSSLLGRLPIPFYGPYNASKFALEALADNYRFELSGYGIESVLVEPGGYPTTFIDALIKPSDAARTAAYGDRAKAPEMALAAFEERLKGPGAPDPQWVADAVAELLRKPRGQRPFRTVVDRLGLGAAIEPYNQAFDGIQKGVFGAFGMADALVLKV